MRTVVTAVAIIGSVRTRTRRAAAFLFRRGGIHRIVPHDNRNGVESIEYRAIRTSL